MYAQTQSYERLHLKIYCQTLHKYMHWNVCKLEEEYARIRKNAHRYEWVRESSPSIYVHMYVCSPKNSQCSFDEYAALNLSFQVALSFRGNYFFFWNFLWDSRCRLIPPETKESAVKKIRICYRRMEGQGRPKSRSFERAREQNSVDMRAIPSEYTLVSSAIFFMRLAREYVGNDTEMMKSTKKNAW